MDFKITRIPPEGRNKYGNYTSAGRTTKIVTSYVNGGNTTTTGGNTTTDDNNDVNKPTTTKNCTIILSNTNGSFDWDDIVANQTHTETINVLGYGDLTNIPVFVGDLKNAPINTEDIPDNRQWDIKGVPARGMSVEVEGNGTTNVKLKVSVNEYIQELKGELLIPCSVYVGPENQAPYAPSIDPNTGVEVNNAGSYDDYVEWTNAKDNCKTIWLQYNYVVNMNAVNNYYLELTNEIAGVNVDSAGNIIAGTTLPSCKATLYYGNTIVEDATYGIGNRARAIDGVSINTNTGELTFGTNFTFIGDLLEIPVYATKDNYTTTKIMSINKIYPGKDGAGSINRWIVPSVDVITWNPNDNNLSQTTISAKVMKQENADTPVEDTQTTIYWGWDTDNPLNAYTGPISVEVSKKYLSLALKANNKIYEIETIPVIKEGVNGEKGESTYTLVLTNTNASINCDETGYILPNANRPECEAYLYYGSTLVEDVVFSVNTTATGVEMDGNRLVYDRLAMFYFEGDSVALRIEARKNNVLYGTATLNITKVKAPSPGKDAVSYWLTSTYSCFQLTTEGVPRWNFINFKAYKQEGNNEPTEIINPDLQYTINHYTTYVKLTNGNLNYNSNADYFTVVFYVGDVKVDTMTIPVLKDGVKGEPGQQGPTIRGPYDYVNMTPITGRRWCNGVLTDVNYPEDAQFIDVILFKGKYYKCKTSYLSKENQWTDRYLDSTIELYWEESDAAFDFVAANLLLAENAKIAGFTFSDNRLVSTQKNDDGTPTLTLDGNNGIINAYKGIWKGATWYNFKGVYCNSGDAPVLSADTPNYILYGPSMGQNPYVYLPEITKDIDGCKLTLVWANNPANEKQAVLKAHYSTTYPEDGFADAVTTIVDGEVKYPFGANLGIDGYYEYPYGSTNSSSYTKPILAQYDLTIPVTNYINFPINRITFRAGQNSFIELMADYYHGCWVVLNRTKIGFQFLGKDDNYVYLGNYPYEQSYQYRKWGSTISEIGESAYYYNIQDTSTGRTNLYNYLGVIFRNRLIEKYTKYIEGNGVK